MSFDPGARGIAAQARAAAAALSLRNLGNVGIRIFGGRVANAKALASGAAAGRTFEVVATTALPFDAIRVVMAFGQTSGANAITPSAYVSVKPVAEIGDAAIATDSGWTAVTFGGANGIGGSATPSFAPAADQNRRVYTVSDVIPVASVARSDGGRYPAVVIRAYLYTSGTAGNYVIQGNGSQNFDAWETHLSGRIWRMRGKGGNFANTTQSGMTRALSVAENGAPIVGIVYYARGKVVNVAGFGDSITEGQGTYVGEGFGFPACQALSDNATGIAYEWSNLGWSGQTTGQIRQQVLDAVATPGLKFDIGVLPGGSPNDITATIGEADIAATRFKVSHMLDLMRGGGMATVLWTWLPTNTAVRNYGASDSQRRALNDDYRTWGSRGAVIADFDKALAGATSGGQVQLLTDSADDNIHPSDGGNARLSPLLARAVQGLSAIAPGMLAA